MIRSLFLILVYLGLSSGIVMAQSFIKTADLFKRPEADSRTGQLNISQDPALDTLINRYILMSKKVYKEMNYYGMNGFRIQIYASSNRNAREESNKARADFINKFPDIVSYPVYQHPGYFKIRVGDFRTRTEATKLFLIISKEFPDAYIVPDIINFPDLNTK
ncbi:MAG: SPOR domain-containing protein [Bacteroidales bacterium]|nr:SPOR domain-containing protein [Bacteroidales bacterium]